MSRNRNYHAEGRGGLRDPSGPFPNAPGEGARAIANAADGSEVGPLGRELRVTGTSPVRTILGGTYSGTMKREHPQGSSRGARSGQATPRLDYNHKRLRGITDAELRC